MRTIWLACLLALSGIGCDDPSDFVHKESPPPTTTPAVSVPQTTVYVPLRPDYQEPVEVPTTLPATDCAEWYPLAMQVGWPAEEWPAVSKIMWRESRCNPLAHNGNDPKHGTVLGSISLLQINTYWCTPSKWSERGWLQDRGVLDKCEDLFDAETNLRAGLLIYLYSYEKHGFDRRFGPWTTAYDI